MAPQHADGPAAQVSVVDGIETEVEARVRAASADLLPLLLAVNASLLKSIQLLNQLVTAYSVVKDLLNRSSEFAGEYLNQREAEES